MRDLDGKVAVLTGAGSPRGIGRATATLFAARGARVVLADVDPRSLDATVRELRSAGADACGIATDVTSSDSMTSLAEEVYRRFDAAHFVFLNAGIGSLGTLLGDDLADWQRIIDVNFLGVLHGIKAFVPRMIEGGEHTHVMATASVAGVTGLMYTNPAYTLTKQATCSLMECLHGELAALGADVCAQVLLPPMVRTNLAGDPDRMAEAGELLNASGVPTVVAEPEDVATTVLEAVLTDSFWAHRTFEQDQRVSEGRFERVIGWEDDMARARAAAIVDRLTPGPYLWGRRRQA